MAVSIFGIILLLFYLIYTREYEGGCCGRNKTIKKTTLAVKKILLPLCLAIRWADRRKFQIPWDDMERHIIQIMVIKIISKIAPFSTSL